MIKLATRYQIHLIQPSLWRQNSITFRRNTQEVSRTHLHLRSSDKTVCALQPAIICNFSSNSKRRMVRHDTNRERQTENRCLWQQINFNIRLFGGKFSLTETPTHSGESSSLCLPTDESLRSVCTSVIDIHTLIEPEHRRAGRQRASRRGSKWGKKEEEKFCVIKLVPRENIQWNCIYLNCSVWINYEPLILFVDILS